jgi:transposase-like protein
MIQRRTFTAAFKTQVVLDCVSRAHSATELCRQHQLNPQPLSRWKTEFLEGISLQQSLKTNGAKSTQNDPMWMNKRFYEAFDAKDEVTYEH